MRSDRASAVRLGWVLIMDICVVLLLYVAYTRPYSLFGVEIIEECSMRFHEPHFFVCTHDYEHVDLFALLKQVERLRLHSGIGSSVVVADMFHNRLFECWARGMRCIYTNGGTVCRVLQALKTTHVFMFLYRDASQTGAYHIIKSFDGPVCLMKIESHGDRCVEHDALRCIRATSFNRFNVRFEPFVPVIRTSTPPKKFVRRLLRQLYMRREYS